MTSENAWRNKLKNNKSVDDMNGFDNHLIKV